MLTGSIYRAGLWTPTIVGSTTPGTQTYSRQTGTYSRIGNRVFLEFNIILSALDGATAGNVGIGGLPFAATALTGLQFPGAIGTLDNITHGTNYAQWGIRLQQGLQVINLFEFCVVSGGGAVASASVQATALASNTSLTGSINYRAA